MKNASKSLPYIAAVASFLVAYLTWGSLVTHHNGWGFAALPHISSVDGAEGCSDFPIADVRALSGLYSRAASADHTEVRTLLCVLPKLDGGELEDALIALGKAMDRDPVFILRAAQRHEMSDDALRSSAHMLSLNFGDDLHAQLAALGRRLHKVQAVSDPRLGTVRDEAVASINDAIAETRRALASN
jgi:hypothetical protein